MKYIVIVDIPPKKAKEPNGCHKYVFGKYRTKKEAEYFAAEVEKAGMGTATIERR